jgi:hypothetical protein
MLRHISNPFVIRDAINVLTVLRNSFEKSEFRKGEDPWLLRKPYGLDHDGAAPLGILRMYQLYSKLATDTPKENESPNSDDELNKEMIGIFDQQIKRLEFLEAVQRAIDEQGWLYQTAAALVPPQDVMERLIRDEAHLSREFDRTLVQLERHQRIRLGQPVPPSVRLEL